MLYKDITGALTITATLSTIHYTTKQTRIIVLRDKTIILSHDKIYADNEDKFWTFLLNMD